MFWQFFHWLIVAPSDFEECLLMILCQLYFPVFLFPREKLRRNFFICISIFGKNLPPSFGPEPPDVIGWPGKGSSRSPKELDPLGSATGALLLVKSPVASVIIVTIVIEMKKMISYSVYRTSAIIGQGRLAPNERPGKRKCFLSPRFTFACWWKEERAKAQMRIVFQCLHQQLLESVCMTRICVFSSTCSL